MADSKALTTHDITFAAAGVALMTVAAWVTVPVGAVPFTLQTMAVAFVALALSPRAAVTSMVAYALLGAVGLPVFSGMRGGVGVLFGPTGGFIIGFIVATIAAEALLSRKRTNATKVATCVLLMVVMYVFGWAWLMVSTGMDAASAFAVACAPFIIPDIVKIGVGAAVAEAVTSAVPSLQNEA
jgi:biotin transport system substrate-specific component